MVDTNKTDEVIETETVSTPVSTNDQSLAKWYVVHTQSGFEAKSKSALEQRIKSLGYETKIFDIVIPLRDVVTIKKGKKKNIKEKIFTKYLR